MNTQATPTRPRPRRALRALGRLVLAVGALGGLSVAGTFAAAEAHRALAADPPRQAALIVVFGGEFGNNPCRADTDFRMLRALEVAALMPEALVVLTETLVPYPALAEANIAVLARLSGLPEPARLLVEPRATSTFENVRFTAELLGGAPEGRVLLVTDAVHMARARVLWRHFMGAWPDYALARTRGRPLSRVRLSYHLREAAAWWLNLGKVAAWEGLALAGVGEDVRGRLIR